MMMTKAKIKKKKKEDKENLVVEREKLSPLNPYAVTDKETIKTKKVDGKGKKKNYERWTCKICEKPLLKSLSGGVAAIRSFDKHIVYVKFEEMFVVCGKCRQKGKEVPYHIFESWPVVEKYEEDPSGEKLVLPPDAFQSIYRKCINSRRYKKILKKEAISPKEKKEKIELLEALFDEFFLKRKKRRKS